MNSNLAQLLRGITETTRSVFISYHHKRDQAYCDALSQVAGSYNVFRDRSLRDKIDSTNPEYVIQQIRQKYITGSSCTIVLCGPETYKRRYVDWETKATLDKEHGIIAVQLPNLPVNHQDQVTLPSRLNANINSGYALWLHWDDITSSAEHFKQSIEEAVSRSNSATYKAKIINPKEIKKLNG